MNEDIAQDLMAELGEDAFITLVEAYGGTRLYVPANIQRSDLPAAIGGAAADALSKLYPGGYIKVPLARELRAARYREQGASNATIARKLGLTESGVQRLLSRQRKKAGDRPARRDDRQIDLFK